MTCCDLYISPAWLIWGKQDVTKFSMKENSCQKSLNWIWLTGNNQTNPKCRHFFKDNYPGLFRQFSINKRKRWSNCFILKETKESWKQHAVHALWMWVEKNHHKRYCRATTWVWLGDSISRHCGITIGFPECDDGSEFAKQRLRLEQGLISVMGRKQGWRLMLLPATYTDITNQSSLLSSWDGERPQFFSTVLQAATTIPSTRVGPHRLVLDIFI